MRKFRSMVLKFRTSQELDLEVKRNGMETHGKWQATANLMLEQFEESGHPVSQIVSPLSRGILRKKKNKETMPFTSYSLDTDLSIERRTQQIR